MIKDKDALAIIANAYEEMKEEGVATYRCGKPNLAELSRRSGFSRKVVKRIYDNNFEEKAHGNEVKKGSRVISGGLRDKAEGLLRQGVTNSSVIHERLKEAGYKGGLSSVKNFIRYNMSLVPAKRELVSKPQGKVRRYETGPGEMYQMDWGFVNVEDCTGGTWRCACFVIVCHHCGMRYAEFFPNAKQENLFIGMLHALSVMGIPKTVLTDNMSSVVTGRDSFGGIIFNREYDDFQHVVGFATRLCKVRHPWTKGAVERLVRFVKDNFIQGRMFINITDLNEQALKWCMRCNSSLHKGLGTVPDVKHAEEPLACIPGMDALLPFLAPERSITMDGFVFYEGRRYGVPFSYIGRKVRVMRNRETLYILDPNTFSVIETHNVDWSRRPHYSAAQFEPTQPEEHPTAAVRASIGFSGGRGCDDDFKRFDF